FPLFFWLPASYPTLPAGIGALFAGLLTKVGVYALIRVFTLVFPDGPPWISAVVLAVSGATMIVGLVGAVAERDFRRVLSFNLVGHIGLTTVGIGLATRAALGGSILYLFHHMLVITNLFLISGLFLRLRRTTDFTGLGGMYDRHRLATALAIVPVFSLAGVPPLSGFIAKLAIVEAVFAAHHYWMGAVVLLASLLTLLSMARLWDESFAKPAAPEADVAPLTAAMLVPVAALTILIVVVTFAAKPLVEISNRAAEQLLQKEVYVRAVLEAR